MQKKCAKVIPVHGVVVGGAGHFVQSMQGRRENITLTFVPPYWCDIR